MHIRHKAAIGAVAAATLSATVALAQGGPEAAIGARQAHMSLYAHNLGILGGMAQGNMDYDAEMAAAAAADLHALAGLSQQAYWPEGTDNGAADTKALPAIWEDMDDFESKADDLVAAAAEMETAAGESLESLQGAMRAVGGACGACHQTYRVRDN